jgi:FkbM family methyltransferase
MSVQAQVATVNSTGIVSHHPVFLRFPCWEGTVPKGFLVDFLGVMTRADYRESYREIAQRYSVNRHAQTEYPPFDEEYFEWIDLLEAVASAENCFTMMELGAGFGPWTARAAAALRQAGNLPYTLVGVEAEPTHFQWMIQHLRDNFVDPTGLRLVRAAVSAASGKVGFYVGETQYGKPDNWYGQCIGGPHMVDAVDLNSLLEPLDVVDLIDIDVQGAELEVLEAASRLLDEKVKRVHIGTHGAKIEDGLHSLFGRLGWRRIRSFPCASTVDTEWGSIRFQDGVQTWLNPTYCNTPKDDVASLTEKLNSCRVEGARLWAELEKGRRELDKARLNEQSLGWKMAERIRRARGRMAPVGSRRRRVFDFIAERI